MARALFTDRHGGQSTGPYRDFNLALHVGDDPEVVARNRSLLAASLGIPATSLRFMNQIHGSRIAVAGTSDETAELPEADALFTQQSGVALVVLVADCIPLLLVSDQGVAAVHVGRKGLVAGIVENSIQTFIDHDIKPATITAKIGPSICKDCYEVDLSMYEEISQSHPACATTLEQHCLDLVSGVVTILATKNIAYELEPRCTREDRDLFSYRRDGITGRQAGVVLL